MSGVDYGLVAAIAVATSFFGAFGKELADEVLKWVRKVRSLARRSKSKLETLDY